MNSVERFVEASSGAWTVGTRPAVRTLVDRLQSGGWKVAVIDGRRCPTKAALLVEIARALDFPEWFGHNWDALADCLGDAAAQPLAIVVTAAHQVGADEPDAAVMATLMSIVDDLAAEGSTVKLAARSNRAAAR